MHEQTHSILILFVKVLRSERKEINDIVVVLAGGEHKGSLSVGIPGVRSDARVEHLLQHLHVLGLHANEDGRKVPLEVVAVEVQFGPALDQDGGALDLVHQDGIGKRTHLRLRIQSVDELPEILFVVRC